MSLVTEIETKKGISELGAKINADSYGRGAAEAEVRRDDYAVATKIFEHIAKALDEDRPILLSEPDLRIIMGRVSGSEISERLGSIVTRTTEETESSERSIVDCKILQAIALEGAE